MAMSFGDIMLGALGWVLLIAGYLFTVGLLLVPYLRLKALWIAEQGVDHFPFMYFLSLINSLTWVAYGLLPPLKNAVMIISVIGAVIQVIYIIWYICICAHPIGRFVIAFFLVVLLLSSGIIACFMVFFGGLFGVGPNSLDTPATITSILSYIGPLADTVMAISTGDPGRMSVPVMVASLGNAVCWGEYGRVRGERIIRFANEIGVISPIFQLLVYHVLRRKEILVIYKEEIPQFFAQLPHFLAQITEFVSRGFSKYVLLRHDDNEDDDA